MAKLKSVSHPPGDGPSTSARGNSYELSEIRNSGLDDRRRENSEDFPAVVLRNAYKHFRKGEPVLENLNMTVKPGTMYTVVGSRGSGKTTLLSVIVGVRRLNSGTVFVLGHEPGAKGKSVGYMPQDISLYNDFSIEETLAYFGTLCGMERSKVATKIEFLMGLLRLNDKKQRVGTLSGGQRKRTAFAVALIHDKFLLAILAFADFCED